MNQQPQLSGDPGPLYRAVADRLRAEIVSGAIVPGAALPSEQQLTETFGVSRITVRRALEELAREGLLERRQGRATRVRPFADLAPLAGEHRVDLMNAIALARATEVRLLEAGIRHPPDEVRHVLGLPEGHGAFMCQRLRLYRSHPLCLNIAWVPARFAAALTDEALTTQPMLTLLMAAGARPARTEQALGAVAAGPQAAALLDVAEGSPLLEVARLLRDGRDEPIQYLNALFRADRYRYHMVMVGGGEAAEAAMLL